ncbi:hypothetical protein BS50DRAFT_660516 [Corynespora cassiicola Philippines]|uniref:Heterokaryon incompatibility domain-containing protein n=1 Tax=Corynespora cassiicola Philippines TaxID=1448308 RepID=A0A2T2P140_CORCC|nr:hypothetical protein BS50DRAFT_660516 [Corynespora cassiicola Philippines]
MALLRVTPRQIIPIIGRIFEEDATFSISLLLWRNDWEEESTMSGYDSVSILTWLCCNRSCSDPRDYVFGLTGLLPDSERLFDVDYSLTVNETYVGFAKRRIMRADYGVMIFSGIGLSSIRHTSPNLSSWSPDWHALGKMEHIGVISEPLYSAGLSSTTPVQMPYFEAQNTVIVPGIALCSLSEILEGFSDWYHPDDTRWKNLVFHSNEGKAYFNGMPLLQAYFKTIMADEDPHYRRRLVEPRARGTDDIPCIACSTLCFNFLRTYCIDSCNTISKDEREGFKQKLLTERDISDTLGMGCFYKEDQKPSKEDWAFKMEASDESLSSDIEWLMTYRSQSFFTTKEGYMGTGPSYARKGDLICVFYNAKIPFILRPYKDGYKLVGAAFVLGFMDGEAFENLDDSWTPEHFKIY